MNMKQFRYVLVLAREGSFSRAADVLGISQPSLSQYIKKIEQEVGMSLFNRIKGNVWITDAGQVYIEAGRRMLDLEHQLEERISDLATYRAGTISIGLSAHRSVVFMPPVVKAFKDLYPGIVLRVVEKPRVELMDAAEHGEFDLVVTTLPVPSDLFDYETLLVEENVVASARPLNAQKADAFRFPVISARSLNGMSFAMLNEDHLMQRMLNDLMEAYHLQLKKEVECTSLEALVQMVKTGVGAALIPACLAKDDLYYYSIQEGVPKREIVLMYRKNQYLSRAILDLKTMMHTILGQHSSC